MNSFLDQANDWAARVERAAKTPKPSLLFGLVSRLIADNPLLKTGVGPKTENALYQQQKQIRERLDCNAKETKTAFHLTMFGVAIMAGFSAAAFSLLPSLIACGLCAGIALIYGVQRVLALTSQHHARDYFFGPTGVSPEPKVWMKQLHRTCPDSPARQTLRRDIMESAKLTAVCAALAISVGGIRGVYETQLSPLLRQAITERGSR